MLSEIVDIIVYILLGIGVFCISVYIGVGVPLVKNDGEMWWLLVIMFPLPFIGLIGLIGGLITTRVHSNIKRKTCFLINIQSWVCSIQRNA